jgi:hypothetical protein
MATNGRGGRAEAAFAPEILIEGEGVSVWLPQLEVYGEGADLQSALDDLVDEVRSYSQLFLDQAPAYLASPNRAGHYPYVVHAAKLDREGRLGQVLAAAAEVRS